MKTLNELIKEKISYLEEDGQIGTRNSYRTLHSYITSRFGEVKITDFNASFARNFKAKLIEDGKSPSTIHTYLSLLTAIFNYSTYLGLTREKDYPVRRRTFEVDKPTKPKMLKRNGNVLTIEQMKSIYELWNELYDDDEVYYLGLFLVSYLSNGANLQDVMRFRWNENNNIIVFQREKTKRKSDMLITVPIIQPLRNILDKIASKYEPETCLFDLPEKDEEKRMLISSVNNKVSSTLRKFSKTLGLTEKVSVTYARHTYATVMNRLGAPFTYIELSMGHSLNGVVGNYVANYQIEDAFKWNSMLL